jgi:error-prone DNA polymerase
MIPPFVHLHTHSCYSFLDGADQPEDLVRRAAELGMTALALTDHDSTAAVVKFVEACRQFGVIPVIGAELTMQDDSHLTLLAQSSIGYANLNRLISVAHENDEGGERRAPRLPWAALGPNSDGLICLTGCRRGRVPALLRQNLYEEAEAAAHDLLHLFGSDRLYAELQDDYTPDSLRVSQALAALAKRIGVKAVATNNVHYVVPDGYATHDLLRAIASGSMMGTPHSSRPLNRERYLKSAGEMSRTFAWNLEAIVITEEIAARCAFSLPSCDITPRHEGDGEAAVILRRSVQKGAIERYRTITPEIRRRIDHELAIINRLGFTDYLLVCRDVVEWARSTAGIRTTGRGSAADSLVAYALYLTDVDVLSRNLPFARFLTDGKLPDVDLDFDKSRRDEVFHHIKARYGATNVAMVCTFFTFHARSAVRDVGKAIGLPSDVIDFFAERLHWKMSAGNIEAAFEKYAELKDQKHLIGRFQKLMSLCARIAGLPRHIGTHSSGVMISRIPLVNVAAMIPSAKGLLPILTLDKNDIEEIKGLKLDILSLGSLASVSHAEAAIQRARPEWRYDDIPADDDATYAMIGRGESMGTHELQSPAQRALAVMLQPRGIEDLEAAIAMIRPATHYSGSVRENTVKRFLHSRNGYEPIDYIHPRLMSILAPTYGCVIYQETVDSVIAAMTGWSDAKAEQFRKSLAKHTRAQTLPQAGQLFAEACLAYDSSTDLKNLNRLWITIQGWGSYGFTHGHAASFAITSYRTAYLQVHEPAAFYAGLMNEYPMGYWPLNTLAGEARRRGVTILPVCINQSVDKCLPDHDGTSIRLGLRVISRLGRREIEMIETQREREGPYTSLLDFCVRIVLRRDQLENLLLTGAFDSLHRHRRGLMLRLDETLTLAASFRATTLSGQPTLPLGSWKDEETPCASETADLSPFDKMMWSWRVTGVCTDAHPIAFMRPDLAGFRIRTTRDALLQPPKSTVIVAGLNVRPHRPPTRTGRKVLFSTVEDETGLAQTLAIEEALEKTTAVFLLSPAVIVKGTVEKRGNGSSLLVIDAKPLRLNEIRK